MKIPGRTVALYFQTTHDLSSTMPDVAPVEEVGLLDEPLIDRRLEGKQVMSTTLVTLRGHMH